MESVGRGRYIIDDNFGTPICCQELSPSNMDNLFHFGQETHCLNDPRYLAVFFWDSVIKKFRLITNYMFYNGSTRSSEGIKLNECFFTAKASLRIIDASTTPKDTSSIIIDNANVLFGDGFDLLKPLVRRYHDCGGLIVCATDSDTALRPPEYEHAFWSSGFTMYARNRYMNERVSGHMSIAVIQKNLELQTINVLVTWDIGETTRIINKPIPR